MEGNVTYISPSFKQLFHTINLSMHCCQHKWGLNFSKNTIKDK